MKVNLELNAWSVGTTLAVVTAAVVYAQADLRGLEVKDRRRLEGIRAEWAAHAKRARQADEPVERDRDILVAMQDDIRVIRQILESPWRAPASHAPR